MTRAPITRAKFRAWLETFEPQQVVGRALDIYCCPVANYLKSTGIKRPSVGKHSISDRATGVEWQSPRWLTLFIHTTDKTEPDDSSIEARTALCILDEVTHG